MTEYVWICGSCGELFIALKEDGSFSFSCPTCKSNMTKPFIVNHDGSNEKDTKEDRSRI